MWFLFFFWLGSKEKENGNLLRGERNFPWMHSDPGMYSGYNMTTLLPSGLGQGGLGFQQNIRMAPQGQVPLPYYPQYYTGPVMMYTNSPPSSRESSPVTSPVHRYYEPHQVQSHFVGIGNNTVMVPHQQPDGVDDDESKLQRVLRDASDQIREAKRVVTKSMMRNHKQKAVQVQLLRGLGATAVESIPFMRPSNAREALRSVSLLISTVSSKLVPEMRTQRQKHIVYVMRIMETYVKSMMSLVSKKEPDQEENYDESDEVSKDAIERILVKLQEADAWIPNKLHEGDNTKENVESIIKLCETIRNALTALQDSPDGARAKQAQRASATTSRGNLVVINGSEYANQSKQ